MKLLGYKCGMSQYRINKKVVPVTVIHIPGNTITQIKNHTQSIQHAIEVTSSNKRIKTRALKKHLEPSGITTKSHIVESRVKLEDLTKYKVGDKINLDIFKVNQKVDVTAISKGKGFQGPVKRWGFSMQPASHGTSLTHRAHGSTGGCQDPGKVFKGKKMAGRMGGTQITVQSLSILSLDIDNKIIAVKGSIPGPKGAKLRVGLAVKTTLLSHD